MFSKQFGGEVIMAKCGSKKGGKKGGKKGC